MNKDLLNSLKEKYNTGMQEKNKNEKDLQVLLDRKQILENSPIVRDYIELLKQIKKHRKNLSSENKILSNLIHEVEYRDNDDTNGIYFYMGSFIHEGNRKRLVDRDYHLSEFDRYIDIESLCFRDNPVEDREIFERENIVILSGDLYDLHDEFIIDCITKDQDAAVAKVLSRK